MQNYFSTQRITMEEILKMNSTITTSALSLILCCMLAALAAQMMKTSE
ncbi:MAG TPA: hypothetical protein PKL85_03240 [Bacteroidia bacterium]|nr:hypothetical protein [Bacteroidia bacterium]